MKNILMVFGGKSYEHDISVVTASQIINKTKLEQFNFILLYISRDGKFYIYNSKKFNLKDFSVSNFSGVGKKFKEAVFVSGENNIIFSKTHFGLKEYSRAESAILMTHGGAGENGKLVAFFEQFNIGCSVGGVDSLAICMNKYLFKMAMRGLKIPTITGFKISKEKYLNSKENYLYALKFMTFPAIIKSNNGGSSIGVFVAKNKDEFEEKLMQAFEFDSEVLVERFIKNCREFNVAVLGDETFCEVSDVDEPIKKHELLSFADKYESGGSKTGAGKLKSPNLFGNRKFPAEISDDLAKKLKEASVKIFTKLGLCGVVRIDFLYDEVADKFYVCEANTIPGSLAYYFFGGNKILVNDLVCKLIQISERAVKKNNEFNHEFITSILE